MNHFALGFITLFHFAFFLTPAISGSGIHNVTLSPLENSGSFSIQWTNPKEAIETQVTIYRTGPDGYFDVYNQNTFNFYQTRFNLQFCPSPYDYELEFLSKAVNGEIVAITTSNKIPAIHYDPEPDREPSPAVQLAVNGFDFELVILNRDQHAGPFQLEVGSDLYTETEGLFAFTIEEQRSALLTSPSTPPVRVQLEPELPDTRLFFPRYSDVGGFSSVLLIQPKTEPQHFLIELYADTGPKMQRTLEVPAHEEGGASLFTVTSADLFPNASGSLMLKGMGEANQQPEATLLLRSNATPNGVWQRGVSPSANPVMAYLPEEGALNFIAFLNPKLEAAQLTLEINGLEHLVTVPGATGGLIPIEAEAFQLLQQADKPTFLDAPLLVITTPTQLKVQSSDTSVIPHRLITLHGPDIIVQH